jgi:hypothetical protein
MDSFANAKQLRSRSPRSLRRRRPLAFLCMLAGALLTLLLVAVAPAMAASPITWSPAASTYGSAPATAFVVVGAPAPPGSGATQLAPSGMAYGAGFWNDTDNVYVMGFVGSVPTSTALPTMVQTELAGTALPAGTALTLVFDKTAGQHIDSIAMLGDSSALVSVTPADPAALDAATQFTVNAGVVDPVASASGDVAAAFGLMIDCSPLAGRDYQGSIFVTNMHWLDVDPPTFTSAGLAGLSAHGLNGTAADFDGIFTPAFLAIMGIDPLVPSAMQGYIDVTAVTGWAGASLTSLGVGLGTDWPLGSYKYRITNSTWSTHNIMFGKLSAPAKAVGTSPSGGIHTTLPTFKWKAVKLAATYEVRVYRGSTLVLKKTGIKLLSWKAGRALPKRVYLTWKVRATNASGAGAFSTALRFKIT